MTLRTQSRRASLAESLANIIVGLWIQMAACLGAFKFLGIHMDWKQFTTFTVFMTGVSVARSYCLRRLWNAEWWKRFRSGRCSECKQKIDPDWCWCGSAIKNHGISDGHGPIPMGCTCGFDKT